ncbi:MAG: DUF3892 domain-containing protein [Clostridium sp.]|uniref:DUF3892 domain-containing protein n=1 Tax=Clostridium sp. TaxID=1506 RepID=UPI003F3E7BF8
MNNLSVTKVLTNNGVPMAYELSNGTQITLEEALSLARSGSLQNVTPSIDSFGHEFLVGTSDDSFSLNCISEENINRPSD